jgi:hypothetical protein
MVGIAPRGWDITRSGWGVMRALGFPLARPRGSCLLSAARQMRFGVTRDLRRAGLAASQGVMMLSICMSSNAPCNVAKLVAKN